MFATSVESGGNVFVYLFVSFSLIFTLSPHSSLSLFFLFNCIFSFFSTIFVADDAK